MKKSTLKKHFRKALSVLLAMTFVLSSALTLSAFANGDETDPANPSQLGSYYEVGATGQGTQAYDTSLKTAEDGSVSVQKNISETGNENVFDIDLIVTTKEQFTSSEIKGDAAVVLVMDVSNSMTEPIGNTTRMAAAKNAAVNFIGNYIADANSARRMVSIVEFGSNAKTVLDWTNAAADSGTVTNAINNNVGINFTDSRIPGNHKDGGGTNIEGGLTLAYNLLGLTGTGQSLNGISALYVVLLSDGCPTFHIASNANRSSLEFILGAEGGGNYAIYNQDVKPAEAAAAKIRTVATLYSIAFASGSDNCYTIQGTPVWVHGYWDSHGHWHFGHIDWNRTEVSIEQWLTSISNGYYSANSASELGIAFGEISTNIQHSSDAGTVTDPMGSNIVFDISYFNGNSNFSTTDNTAGIYFDTVTHQLTWNVSKSTPTTDTVDDVTYYTYKLTYRIILDTAAIKNAAMNGEVDETAYYLTNGRTTLTYTKTDGEDTVGASIDFRVPTVRAYFGSLNFDKVASYGDRLGLSGAVFTLSNSDSSVVMTATSQEDGSVSFTDIPSGSYTLTETSAPEGHELNRDPYTVSVSYGVVTVMDSSEQTITLEAVADDFTQAYVTVSGTKVWANVPDGTTVPAITITLKQDGTEINSVTLQPGTTAFSFDIDSNGALLPKYRADHTEYAYTVEESTVAGYTQAVDGYTITNTYIDQYFYRVDRVYNYYLDDSLANSETITGTVTLGTMNQVVTEHPDNYLSYGGKIYTFVDGPTSVTLNVKNGIAVLTLNYECHELTPPTPPETTNYLYQINVTYKTLKDGVLDSTNTVTGSVVETTNSTLTLNTDDYKMYGGNEYAYVSGPRSVTLRGEVTNVIELVYERSVITPPTPPYTGIDGNMGLLAVLAAVSGASLVTVAIVSKKSRKTK